jgi:hypothetical protein
MKTEGCIALWGNRYTADFIQQYTIQTSHGCDHTAAAFQGWIIDTRAAFSIRRSHPMDFRPGRKPELLLFMQTRQSCMVEYTLFTEQLLGQQLMMKG